MRLSQAFNFKRKRVYALPTLWGLAFFSLICASFWFSYTRLAPLEQWFSVLMIIFTLLHLLDANDPFGVIYLEVQVFEPPYSNRVQKIPFLIENPSLAASETIFIRLQSEKDWLKIESLAPKSSKIIYLPFRPVKKGKQELPRIRMKTRPKSQFFQLWKVYDSNIFCNVLPEPIDQGVSQKELSSNQSNEDFGLLESIRDPRLFHLRDQKLFLKTGKPFLRTRSSDQVQVERSLSWRALLHLETSKQEQQFSFWLERLESEPARVLLNISTPFYNGDVIATKGELAKIKLNFANWAAGHA